MAFCLLTERVLAAHHIRDHDLSRTRLAEGSLPAIPSPLMFEIATFRVRAGRDAINRQNARCWVRGIRGVVLAFGATTGFLASVARGRPPTLKAGDARAVRQPARPYGSRGREMRDTGLAHRS